ncbi:hypothetical protein CORC01_14012 [Colletotrichum orchidophilum]|uniref:Uncharacterized protein n=1 Tax=Colletotrichum orchidophilum TaxID=1209926 RepID=A0A1G4ANQ7_9PEZI|nr:uncharacterized protein CORC01_14012 [Colletotrichum orchidophilum]OHE90683.1 hypothetical protein CORC01_14012 [Colletotrichum orchidophilum]
MAPTERPLASKGGGTDSSRHFLARNEATRFTRRQLLDGQYELQRRPVGAPPRRRIKSSRAAGRSKASSQTTSTCSDVHSTSQHCQSVCFNPPGGGIATSPVYQSSSAAFTQSRFQLSPESRSNSQVQGTPLAQSTVFGNDFETETSDSNITEASKIAVHLDDNTDGYYCFGCGIRRSDEQHMIRKFRDGDPAWRNFCKPCHEKHLTSGGGEALKAYGNFCFGCGFARSSHFNKENPIKLRQKPIKNFCAHCMKRFSQKAVIPTETLLGSSSDESGNESDGPKWDEDRHDSRTSDDTGRFKISPQQVTTKLNNDAVDYSSGHCDSGNVSDEFSPSESVRERLRKRRSARASDAVSLEEIQPKSQCSETSLHKHDTSVGSAASIGHQAPSVEDVSDSEAHPRSENENATDRCNSPVANLPTSVKLAPATPLKTTAQATTSQDCLDPDPSLNSEFTSPSKRARFSERVEVRKSPTYWQREHSEGDDPYAQFRYEQYQDDLRDGKKAVPLKDPLRDPDGQTAGRFHVPFCSIDDQIFNSWSNDGAAGWHDFAARFRSNSYKVSSNNPLHSSTLYASGENQPNNCSTMNDDQPYFTEDRPNPNNRQQQSHYPGGVLYGRGKENQPCPSSPIAPTGWNPLHHYFDGHRNSENDHASDWSSRRDARRTERNNGLFANTAGSLWNAQDHYPSWESHVDCSGSHFDSSSGYPEYHLPFGGFGFNAPYGPNDRGQYPEEDGFYHSNPDSASARQEYHRSHQSPTPKEQRPGYDFDTSDTHENFNKSQSPSSYGFSRHSMDRGTTTGHDAPNDAGIPFESSSTSNGALQEPRLPPIGIVMEIPDDMSDSDVHTLLIPGCDDYVPMAY